MSPISSPSETPYMGFFGMPYMYSQELGPQNHEQFRIETFPTLDDGDYKSPYLKHEMEA